MRERGGWPKGKPFKKIPLKEKVEILYLILNSPMTRREIGDTVGRSIAAIASIKREYCDTKIVKTVTLKTKKKHMSALIQARTEEQI